MWILYFFSVRFNWFAPCNICSTHFQYNSFRIEKMVWLLLLSPTFIISALGCFSLALFVVAVVCVSLKTGISEWNAQHAQLAMCYGGKYSKPCQVLLCVDWFKPQDKRIRNTHRKTCSWIWNVLTISVAMRMWSRECLQTNVHAHSK